MGTFVENLVENFVAQERGIYAASPGDFAGATECEVDPPVGKSSEAA
jgi:hypothetical protein